MTDDTEAINAALAYGNRCGGGDAKVGLYCGSSTVQPALVYIPPGKYLVSSALVLWYFTQLVGDAVDPPTFVVSPNFNAGIGLAVLDADIYIPAGSGATWYQNQNNFFRQVRNFVIDMTQAPLDAVGIHWQVAQATSIQNVVIKMVDKGIPYNKQQGIFMENGSGGFFSDITITGGAIGMYLGNQQFTTRKLSLSGCATAIKINFNWTWLFTQVSITNCDIGIDMTNGGFWNQLTGSVVVLDSVISATQGIITPYVPGFSSPQAAGTLILENVDFTGSETTIAVAGTLNARSVLKEGQYIELFAQGNAWTTAGQALNGQIFNGTACVFQNASQTVYTAQETTIQRLLAPVPRPSPLVDSNGDYVYRVKPQYEDRPVSDFLQARSNNLKGDGVTGK